MNRWDEIQGAARDVASNVHPEGEALNGMADGLIKLVAAMLDATGKVIAVQGEGDMNDAVDADEDCADASARMGVGEAMIRAAQEVGAEAASDACDVERWNRPDPLGHVVGGGWQYRDRRPAPVVADRCANCGGEGGGGTMDPDTWITCPGCEGRGYRLRSAAQSIAPLATFFAALAICPECGRSTGHKMDCSRGRAAVPQCAECGYVTDHDERCATGELEALRAQAGALTSLVHRGVIRREAIEHTGLYGGGLCGIHDGDDPATGCVLPSGHPDACVVQGPGGNPARLGRERSRCCHGAGPCPWARVVVGGCCYPPSWVCPTHG